LFNIIKLLDKFRREVRKYNKNKIILSLKIAFKNEIINLVLHNNVDFYRQFNY